MRSNREGILAGLAGFLIGVLFTLVVHDFASRAISALERRLILLALFVLASAILTLYFKLLGAVEPAMGSRIPSGVDREGHVPPNSASTMPAALPVQRRDETTPHVGGVSFKQPEIRTTPGAIRGMSVPAPRAQHTSNAPEPPLYENSELLAPEYVNNTGSAGADRLPDIWESYFRNGDGKFNATGLKRQLEASGIAADVIPGEHLSLGDSLLGVDFKDKKGLLYLLPNFSKPARAVEDWFQTIGTGSRLARIQRLIRPATARRKGGELILEAKGEVE